MARERRRPEPNFVMSNPDLPMYVISVAAELAGMHAQTLRSYDRQGIVTPGRTPGGGRRYSLRDIERLRVVGELTAQGLGVEGVKRVLELENQVAALQSRVAELEDEVEVYRRRMSSLPVPRAGSGLVRRRR